MNITDWDNNEILQLLMAKGHINQKKLLEAINKDNINQIPQSTFSSKIQRNSLKVYELQNICKLLGYSVYIKKNEKD